MIHSGKAVLETSTRATLWLFYFEEKSFEAMKPEALHYARSCYPEARGIEFEYCGLIQHTHVVRATFSIDLERLAVEQERRHPKYKAKGIPLYSQYTSKE